jgi:Uma2 family endonuclease
MEQPKRREFTANEFLAWAAEQPRGRFELADGWVVAMAPERIAHTRAKLDAVIALRSALAAAGRACEAMTDGVSVRIDERTVYEPDALVRCGPRSPGEAMDVTDPVIVVEVVSPSSRGIDTGAKLAGYFKLPSVRHYLVVNTETRVVIHHHRDAAGAIGVRILHEGVLSLDPPGVEIGIGALFASL